MVGVVIGLQFAGGAAVATGQIPARRRIIRPYPYGPGSMPDLSRREFLTTATSCSAHLALAAVAIPAGLRWRWTLPRGPVVAREPFGALEKVADGVWVLVSTPLGGDRTTLSNGGIIAGTDGVLAIEGFNQPQGAQWLATKARELTGRWPTHVALTHYHSDHSNGLAGYRAEGASPTYFATGTTRALVVERNKPADAARSAALAEASLLDTSSATTLDLGGRPVRVVPLGGHTPSDCALEIDDPNVVFCGDLVWNGMFPNYVDAVPSELARSVRALRRTATTTWVPGHGAIARLADFERYVSMLGEIEQAARAARAKGLSASEAGGVYALPASLGEWTLFNKVFFERAFAAWYKELG
jgi:glyoxylase-like metal-dependent hydrolase (beta-lactamase superfamily II)